MQGVGLLSGKLVDLRPVLTGVVGWREVGECAGTDSEDLTSMYKYEQKGRRF